jgi:hypothetical protein
MFCGSDGGEPCWQNIVINPISKRPGFDLPRRVRVTLNRMRTGRGRCNRMMYKWKLRITPSHDCGNNTQTILRIDW